MKSAYPDFEPNSRGTIVKDCYIKGLHKDMQLALKSTQNFASSDLKTLIDETCRLELAGVNSFMRTMGKVNINEKNGSTK